jgi:aspartyl aminopeptidase
MSHTSHNQSLRDFLQASPTPFHAVASMAQCLAANGFQRLDEASAWHLALGQPYFVTRNDSSLIAFRLAETSPVETGFHVVGTHTDSPCLKLKPQPELRKAGLEQLGVEVYGGALLNPWFDRDLSLAGRVSYLGVDGQLHHALVDFIKPVAVIPSLAIHLDREVNQKRSINPQTDLPPVIMLADPDKPADFRAILLARLQEQYPQLEAQRVLDYEICLYDVQPAAVVGLHEDFITGARLDNLLSCHAGLEALLAASGQRAAMLVSTDHEEVGSASTAGAAGTFLEATLERITMALGGHYPESYRRLLHQSLLFSVDNAHGLHPNFSDRHDARHGPVLNQGPVLKINANQRYASNSETSSLFRRLCEMEEVPVQAFVVRSDMGCGSTIGPIVAADLGIRTVDVGVPTFAMHSIRELAGSKDAWMMCRVLRRFFESP